MQDFKSGLNKMKFDLGIFKKVYCAEEEEKEYERMKKENQPIPDEIYIDNSNHYYRYADAGLSKQEIDELLAYRQLDYLRTIKSRLNLIATAAVVFLCIWLFFVIL